VTVRLCVNSGHAREKREFRCHKTGAPNKKWVEMDKDLSIYPTVIIDDPLTQNAPFVLAL
jgi:hypothetical protein